MKTVLGIDLAKKKFDVALLNNGKCRSKVFENNPAGFSLLLTWLAKNDVQSVHTPDQFLPGGGITPGPPIECPAFHGVFPLPLVPPLRIFPTWDRAP